MDGNAEKFLFGPLFLAARYGRLEVARFLLEEGLAVDKFGNRKKQCAGQGSEERLLVHYQAFG